MSQYDNWPTRSRAGTLIRLQKADSKYLAGMVKGFGLSIERMTYMICVIVSMNVDELPTELMDYPIRFTEDSYITPDQFTKQELLNEKASIEKRILALENQVRIYHSQLESRDFHHPASLFEAGVTQWISNHKQFAEGLFLRHCDGYDNLHLE